MSEPNHPDEALLIDFLLGRCDDAAAADVQRRLEGDAALRHLRDNVANTLGAVGLAEQVEPSADLVQSTMERIRQAQETTALIEREEIVRPGGRSTFSLRELITLAAAAMVLAAVFIPWVREAKRRSLGAQCESNVGQVGSALRKFASANSGMLPRAGGETRRWLPGGGQPTVSNSSALFSLVRNGYAEPAVFQCPAVDVPRDEGSGTTVLAVTAEMTDFPRGRFIHYSYQHTLGPGKFSYHEPGLKAVAERMSILADRTPVFRNGQFLPERVRAATSDNHGREGQNVLYLDGHVEWRDQANAGVGDNNIFLVDGIYEYRGDEAPVTSTDTFLLPASCGCEE